ncbi:MAG: PD-(D/E)XK nuclease-like domain-containing protein [Pseudomonadota bacterium]
MGVPFQIASAGAYDLPEELYHGQPCDGPSISSTGIKKIIGDGPSAFFREWSGNPESEDAAPKKHFDIGRAAHLMMLEPERVKDRVAIYPEDVLSSNGATSTKKARAFEDETRKAGMTPIKQAEWDKLIAMRDRMEAHPHARRALIRGRAEVSLFWKEHGVWLKVRPDFLPDRSGQYVVDYKTCHSLKKWETDALKDLRYDISAAMYLRGVNAVTGIRPAGFLFLVQEKTAPFDVAMLALSIDALSSNMILKRGELDLMRGVERFAQCLETNQWPSPWEEPREIAAPGWLVHQIEKQLESETYDSEFKLAG